MPGYEPESNHAGDVDPAVVFRAIYIVIYSLEGVVGPVG